MLERVLSVVAAGDRRVPSRICALLAQRVVTISSIKMSHNPATSRWIIELVACIEDDADLELLVKRLDRLVDVLEVVDIGARREAQVLRPT